MKEYKRKINILKITNNADTKQSLFQILEVFTVNIC